MKKLTLDIAKAIAFKNNGKCLSEEYINNATSMLWECNNGHQWQARLANIKNSTAS